MLQIMAVFIYIFFQAEDGIRDYKVTGVQTCALPILNCSRVSPSTRTMLWSARTTSTRPRCVTAMRSPAMIGWFTPAAEVLPLARSEERRVGKECRTLCTRRVDHNYGSR